MERHIYHQRRVNIELRVDCHRPASTEPPTVPQSRAPRSQSAKPYRNNHNLSSSSLSSDSSVPGLVEDRDPEPSSTEEDHGYHMIGTQFWDNFWRAQHAEGGLVKRDGNVSPTTCIRRDHSLPRTPSVRLYGKEDHQEQGHENFAPPARKLEGQWPLKDDQVVERTSRQPLRSVASYSIFPRQICVPPRKESLAPFRTSKSYHQHDRSESRRRPAPLSLSHSSQDRSRPSTSSLSIPTPPISTPTTPALLTAKSEPASTMSASQQTRPPSPPTPSTLFQGPTPTFLKQDPNQQQPVHRAHSRSHPVSIFEDSEDENAAQRGLAARIVRGLQHKRSVSETRRSARSGEVAAAQLKRARAASRGSRDGGEEKETEKERERGRKTSSADGVLGRVFGRRMHTG